MKKPRKVIPVKTGRSEAAGGLHQSRSGGELKPGIRATVFNDAWTPADLATDAFQWGEVLELPVPDLGGQGWVITPMGDITTVSGVHDGGMNGGNRLLVVENGLVDHVPYLFSVTQSGLNLSIDCGPVELTEVDKWPAYSADLIGYNPFTSHTNGKGVYRWFDRNNNQHQMAIQGCNRGTPQVVSYFMVSAFRNSDYFLGMTYASPNVLALYKVGSDLSITQHDSVSMTHSNFASPGAWISLSDTVMVVQDVTGWRVITRTGDTLTIGPLTPVELFAITNPVWIDSTHFWTSEFQIQSWVVTGAGASADVSLVENNVSFIVPAAQYPPRTRVGSNYVVGWGFSNPGVQIIHGFAFDLGYAIYSYTSPGTPDSATNPCNVPVVENHAYSNIPINRNGTSDFLVGVDIDSTPTHALATYPAIAYDSSGNGYNGSYENSQGYGIFGAEGLVPGDYSFGGEVVNGPNWDIGNLIPGNWATSFSIEFWYKRSEEHRLGQFFYLSGGYIQLQIAGRVTFFPTDYEDVLDLSYTGASTGTWDYISPEVFPTDHDPHHFVVTFAMASVDSRVVRFYIDGVDIGVGVQWYNAGMGSAAITSPFDDPVDLSTSGGDLNGYELIMDNGSVPEQLDEFALYDHRLTAGQVAAHYAARSSIHTYSLAVMADAPKVYLHLNEQFSGSRTHSSATGSGNNPKMRKVAEKISMKHS